MKLKATLSSGTMGGEGEWKRVTGYGGMLNVQCMHSQKCPYEIASLQTQRNMKQTKRWFEGSLPLEAFPNPLMLNWSI